MFSVCALALLLPSACTNAAAAPAELVVSISSRTVGEAGGRGTVTIVLSEAPDQEVTIPLASSDEGTLLVSASKIVFDAESWSTPQTFAFTGVDDDSRDGNEVATIAMGPSVSGDRRFNGLSVDPVSIAIRDDENTPGITISALSGRASERGESTAFSVVLDTSPKAPVELDVTATDPSEVALSTSTLRFDATNWQVPQVVRVTGLEDGVADGTQPVAIMLGRPKSADPDFASLPPPPVVVVVNHASDAAETRGP